MKILTTVEIFWPRIPIGTTPTIKSKLFVGTRYNAFPLRGSQLETMTITIADVATGLVVNGCYLVNCLNTGRGTVDEAGNIIINWLAGDTMLLDPKGPQRIRRSQVLDWSYPTLSGATAIGRHETIVTITALTEDYAVV